MQLKHFVSRLGTQKKKLRFKRVELTRDRSGENAILIFTLKHPIKFVRGSHIAIIGDKKEQMVIFNVKIVKMVEPADRMDIYYKDGVLTYPVKYSLDVAKSKTVWLVPDPFATRAAQFKERMIEDRIRRVFKK